ncbi:MAG: hypothetical protein ACI835_002855 [Planctomycetota bacterium]|jgi:hypothetical protein
MQSHTIQSHNTEPGTLLLRINNKVPGSVLYCAVLWLCIVSESNRHLQPVNFIDDLEATCVGSVRLDGLVAAWNFKLGLPRNFRC